MKNRIEIVAHNFGILELTPLASWSEVTRAYDRLSRNNDPRKYPEQSRRWSRAVQRQDDITRAYLFLRDYVFCEDQTSWLSVELVTSGNRFLNLFEDVCESIEWASREVGSVVFRSLYFCSKMSVAYTLLLFFDALSYGVEDYLRLTRDSKASTPQQQVVMVDKETSPVLYRAPVKIPDFHWRAGIPPVGKQKLAAGNDKDD